MKDEQIYVIADVRADPVEFLSGDNIFVKQLMQAQSFDLNEGGKIIQAFSEFDFFAGITSKEFMPGLMLRSHFLK